VDITAIHGRSILAKCVLVVGRWRVLPACTLTCHMQLNDYGGRSAANDGA
jgi:hypothetical protein